ncbi:LamG-like jellyroll fold domain-containing protein (plasmid) [Azospirillum melinis]|uniref:LamG-like jellyroll fold domain-containing protein n=1 Tax=Azospirillum melinis TaxID=328839 RepID=UPI0037575F71
MAGWYRQGTVALTPGSAAVAGAGTMWMGVVRPGSAFTTDGRTLYEIREVANDHTLTLDRPWEGETASSSAYAVIAASATLSNAELAGEIAAMVAKWAVREDQYDDWLGGSPNGGSNADGKYPLTDSKGVTRLVESPARLLQLLDDGVVEHAAQIIAAIEDDVATARQAATAATAAMTAVGADRQAVAQAAATVAAQAGESTAAAATATAQAAIAVQRADEAAGSAAAAAGLEASATAALAAVETARDIVLAARSEAGTAATGALSARTAAETARDTATAARDAAQQARDAAVTARTQAQDWAVKTDAPVSGSLKSALSYALDAASQASVATGKATEAAGSAAAAAASAAGLDTAATAAQAAAGDAATGAQTATVKAAAAALSADTARSAAQQAETAESGSATARAAAEAARDSAATAMTAAQVAASQAGQSQTNAANSAQTSATAAADAISAKSDASAARDLTVAARTEAQGARDLSQAFAQGAVGYQPSPGVYSAFHWSEQAKGHAQTAATIVGGSNFGIVGDGTSQRFAAENPGSLLNLVQAPGGKLTFNPGNRAVSFGFDATTAPVAASGNITAGTVQGALEEIDHRLSTLSQDSIANGGGSVRVTEDGAVEIVPAAGRPATYKGGELHTSATAYDKAQTDAAIAAMIAAGQAAGAARLTTPRTIALSGGATGTATSFDGTQNIAIPVTAVAASALTGTIDIARLPAGALERLYPVTSDAERFALTTAQVQKGDTVQVGGTGGLMYLVVDESNLGNATGYRAYTAARASAVDWSGVESKPALLTALASLDASGGVLVQTGAGTAAKRAVGTAASTDIPDRAAADGRYAQIAASNVLSGTVSIQNSASAEAIHVGNGAGTKFTFVGWNEAGGFGRIGAYGSSAWQNFAISEGGSPTAIGTTAMPTGGAKLNVATGIQVDNKDVWHAGNLVPGNYATIASVNTFNGKQTILGTGANLPSNTGIASAIGNTAGFEIQSQGTGTPAGAAFMSFHRPGNYAVHVGLDTDNELKIGGWSMGGIAHKVWHAGNLPVTVSGNAIDFKSSPTVNGAPLATNTNTVAKSAVTVLPATGTLDVPAKSILGVYSQFVGQAFNVDYNTEANYTQENAATGTDQVGGAFQLYNTAGAQIDSATKLLIHADGANGSTEIIDERGITPFGTHCGYIPKDSSFLASKSFKLAFGASQNFTMEGWVRINPQASGGGDSHILDCSDTSADSEQRLRIGYIVAQTRFYFVVNGIQVNASTTSTYDAWHHVAVVRYNGTMTLYVDGVSVGSTTTAFTFPDARLLIGQKSGSTAHGLDGWIDQLRVSKVARYTAGFTVPSTAFSTDADTVHLFSFDDGHGGQVLKDRANSGHEVGVIGNATISNVWAKFGTTSLRLPGDNGVRVAQSKGHSDFSLGSNDFTIDGLGRFDAIGQQTLINMGTPSAHIGLLLRSLADGTLRFYLSSNASSWDLASGVLVGTYAINTPFHWAITRSGSNIYLFKDGVLQNTVVVNTSSITTLTQAVIGGLTAAASGDNMTGYIDEVRIKRGEAVWTSNFTVPTSAYTADDRTILLLHFEGADGDKVTLDSSGASYSTNVFGDTTPPNMLYNGSPSLSATNTRGGHATSIALSGAPQCFYIPFATPTSGHPIYFGANAKLCIEAWVYLPSIPSGTAYELFSLISASSTVANMRCYVNSGSGTVYAVISGTPATNSSTAVLAGWNHIALIRDGRGWAIAVNGSVGSFSNPHLNPTYVSEGYNFNFGVFNSGGSLINYWIGAFDAIRVTNGQPRYTANFTPATLVADDMTTLMWEFNGAVGQKWVKELSGNSALISAANNARTVKDGVYIAPTVVSGNSSLSVSTAQTKFGSGSLCGNGSNGNKQMLSNAPWMSGANALTIEAWVYPTTSTTNIIAQKWDGTNETWQLWLESGTNYPVFRWNNMANNCKELTAIAFNTWTHLMVTVGADGVVTHYINGVKKTTVSGPVVRTDTSGALYLGGAYDGTGNFVGYIDEMRLSSTLRQTATFSPATIPYGASYVTGPFYVATANASRIDVSDWSTIHSATITQTTPPGTSIKWLVSFDGRATWRKWDGSAWVVVPLNSGASIDTNGNDYLTLQNALKNLNVESYGTIDFAFSLKTANPNFSPSVDAVTLARDEYELGAAKIDYTIKRNGAAGAEIHRITNLKPYPVNVVYDYVA